MKRLGLDHAAMRIAYEDMGMQQVKIAQIFGCSTDSVTYLIRRYGWQRPGEKARELDEDIATDELPQDPLGDALEAAGYRRHVHTEPCTDSPIYNWGLR